MITLFRYTKLFAWLGIYKYYPSDIVEDIIIKNINDCGCVVIKFFQWIAPIIEMSEKKEQLFPVHKLDSIYENCNFHSIDYTKSIYEKEYKESFDSKYEIKGLIASASMGQVYKVLEKKTGQIQACKVLHPNLYYHIYLFKLFANFLFKIPFISKWIHYYIPVKVDAFIQSFELQINLVNEANNCMYFRKYYESNPFIVIPEVFRCSENTLFMSYEEGISFEKLKCSEYIKTKSALLLQLFTSNNKLLLGFMHGDTHKGNWKIRIDKDDINPKFVIYDFGYCWKIPRYIMEKSKYIDRVIYEMRGDIKNRHKCLNDIIDMYHIFLNECCSKESIREIVIMNGMVCDTRTLFPQLLQLCRKSNSLIDSVLFQILIITSQLYKNIETYHFTIPDDINVYDHYYSKIVPDIFSFCKTHDIFNEYIEYLKDEYNHYRKNNNKCEYKNDFSQFKSLAIG